MEEHSVSVYVYDISKGFAKTMSPLLIGKQLDGIWHTGIVVYGQEFFFGGEGIQSCDPGTTVLQQPDKIVQLGKTQIPYDMFMDYIHELASSSFRPTMYNLLNHNCNTFSNEVAQFLTGSSIPSYITDLPQEFLNTPLGAMIRPYLDALTVSPAGGSTITSHPETATNSASNQCTTNTSAPCDSTSAMSGQQDSTNVTSAQHDGTDTTTSQHQSQNTTRTCEGVSGSKKQDEQGDRRSYPFTYMDLKLAQQEYTEVKYSLKLLLNFKEVQLLDEILEYITTDEPLWALIPKHIAIIDKILSESQFNEFQKEAVCGLLQECLYHTDIVLMLKHDTNNAYSRILSSFEHQTTRIKIKLAKGLGNCISTDEGLQWLFNEDLTPSNGIGLVAVTVCRCCLLDTDSNLNEIGAALVQSVTHKQISTELAVDFGCALVELLQKDTGTETAKNGILALCQCIKSNSEVAAVAVVSGLNPDMLAEKHPSLKHLCINYLKKHLSQAD